MTRRQAFAAILNEASSSPAAAPAAAALPFGGGGGGGGGGLPAGLPAALAQNPAMLEGLLQNPDLLRRARCREKQVAHATHRVPRHPTPRRATPHSARACLQVSPVGT